MNMQKSILRNDQVEKSIFLQYFQILRKRKWIILISTIGIVIPVLIITKLSTPVYEAQATIIYEEPKDTMFALDMGQPFYNKSAIINLTEQIKSRRLAREVADALPTDVVKSFKFPTPLPENFSQSQYIARILMNSITIANVRGGDILIIKIQASDPNAARVIANTYVERVIEWNLRKKREEISNVRDFVEKQATIFQDKVNMADEALKKFKEENKLVSLSDAAQQILARITEAEVTYNQISAEREALERRINYINQKRKQSMPFRTITSSPRAEQLKEELRNLEAQHSSIQVQGTLDNDSNLASLQQKISQVKNELIQELLTTTQQENQIEQIGNLLQESITLDVELETSKAREQGMKKIIDNYNQELKTIPRQEFDLARLVRDKEVNDKIYSILLEKREEARITEASKVGDVNIVDNAETPFSPIKPQKAKNMALGIILGLGFGIGLAFFLESLDTSLKSQEDIEKLINLPVLASIPNLSQNGVLNKVRRKNLSEDSTSQKLLLQQEITKSHILEAYRTLKLNLAFTSPDKPIKSMMMTSSCPGEGKTLTAINLALLFSHDGIKTLLIDCDLRRPMVHKILKINPEPGLTNLLIECTKILRAVTQNYNNENLSILTCGTIPPNPSELLNSQRMKDLLAEAKALYELVILDVPPIISVTDAMVLGTEVDGACMLIRSGKTSQDAAIKAIKIIENRGIKTSGIILNDVNLKNIYGYYKDYYYYSSEGKKSKHYRSGVKKS